VFPQVEEQIAREAKVKTANTGDDDLQAKAQPIHGKPNPEHTHCMMAENLCGSC